MRTRKEILVDMVIIDNILSDDKLLYDDEVIAKYTAVMGKLEDELMELEVAEEVAL